jgi:transposase
VLDALRRAHPGVRLVWADGGYAGELVEWTKTAAQIVPEIGRKCVGQRGFDVLRRRWVVERTFAWITSAAASTATPTESPPPPNR